MSLSGDLRTMPLPDVLQWIAGGQKTGTLHLERRSIKKRIHVRDGLIHSSWSNDPRESLGQILIRLNLVGEEQLFTALLAQEERGQLLGAILLNEAVLTEPQLMAALKCKAEETIYDLFLWEEGRFEFHEGEFPEDITLAYETSVTPVVLEGARRMDEWNRIREVITTMEVTLRVIGDPETAPDATARQVLTLAAAGKSLAEISLELRRSEFDTAALVFELHGKGLVAIDEARGPGRPSDPIGAIQALLGLAYQRLQDRRFDAAVKIYEEVLSLDRLNQHAKKGILAANEARGRDRAMRSVPLDKVPVLAMDLAALTRETFDSQEGFVLSRVNGKWDVQSILKVCPMSEADALLIFARLAEQGAITLQDP